MKLRIISPYVTIDFPYTKTMYLIRLHLAFQVFKQDRCQVYKIRTLRCKAFDIGMPPSVESTAFNQIIIDRQREISASDLLTTPPIVLKAGWRGSAVRSGSRRLFSFTERQMYS